mmetsp:Transcript_36345/g.65714  ORF Transcript_36345/g.65714 Transcript_36345/m.65714 type:complete len:222 (+) Transcript_36345:760-1425(+)
MLQSVVGGVRVHAPLQGRSVGHLAIVAVQVPLLQRACVTQIQSWNELLSLSGHSLSLVGHLNKNLLRELIHSLVEERRLVLGLAIPRLGTPAAVHHAWVNDHAWVPQADAQVVGAILHPGVDAKQSLQLGHGLFRRGRTHSCKDVVLRAQDGSLPPPLCESARPGQGLEAAEDHVLGFVPKLGREEDVATRARRHRSNNCPWLHVGSKLLEVFAVSEGRNH